MTSRWTYILTAVLFSSLTSPFASAGNIVDKHEVSASPGIDGARMRAGASLLQTRSALLQSGWRPVQLHVRDHYEYIGAERELKDKGIVEVGSCSIDAGVRCIFYYKKNAHCLRIDTVGERVHDMQVTRWDNECPPAQEASL